MSRGFHAFFRQYYNLRGLLRRVDPGLERLRDIGDYPLQHASGLYDSFARVPRTPPWNALGFAALSPSFGWRDLYRLDARAALPLLDVRLPDLYDRYDRISARMLLERIRFPEAAQHLAFEVFSRSFFADPGELSAAELALMFHIYFLGSSEGLPFDVPDEPYPQALWDPLARYLDGHRVRIRTGTPVHAVEPDPHGGHTLVTGDGTDRADALVLALDGGGLRSLVRNSPALCDEAWRARIGRLASAPPFLVHRIWLDRPVNACRPGFSAPAATGRWTTSASWNAGRAKPCAGRGSPADRSWNFTPTRPCRRPTPRRSRAPSWPNSTASTPKHAQPGSSTSADCGAPTARCSPSVPPPTAPRSTRRTPR